VQFIVSKEGTVSNVKAVEVPKACKPCGADAVNTIMASPDWEPAIQNNEPVKYQAIQYVTFVVEEAKKGKRG
jgi:periplasmic protein TonB